MSVWCSNHPQANHYRCALNLTVLFAGLWVGLNLWMSTYVTSFTEASLIIATELALVFFVKFNEAALHFERLIEQDQERV